MLFVRLLGRLGPSELSGISFKSSSSSSLSSRPQTIVEASASPSPLSDVTATSAATEAAPNDSVTIEDSCLKRLKEILDKPQEEYLRVNVETGGCSGFSYMFDIENKNNLDPSDDLIFERDSYRVVLNREILPYMRGSAIEYKESLIKSSFQVKNPIAETKCSCGASFSIDPNKIR